MGEGYGFRCPKCNKGYRVNVGRGMDYEGLYNSAVKEITDGKYGKSVKRAYEEYEGHVVINPEYVVYQCPKCGKWKNQRDVTLYKSGTEVGNSRIIRKYEVKCRGCNMVMRKLKGKSLMNLPCPQCHYYSGIEGVTELIRWD